MDRIDLDIGTPGTALYGGGCWINLDGSFPLPIRESTP